MHCCGVLITEEFPSDEVISRIMEPYDEEKFYELDEWPDIPFHWDYWIVGGRYGGSLRLNMERNDEKYKWGYIIKEPRAGRLFRSRKLEDNKKGHSLLYLEEDNFGYMGAHDGVLYVDGGAIDDMKDIDIEGYLLIDKDGTVYTRDDYSKEYPTIVKNAIENGKGCYICIVDIHS